MSEHEGQQPAGSSSNSWIWIALLGALVGGGCLLTCVGAIGFGFYMPMQARQRAQVEQMKAELAAEQAKAEAEIQRARTEAAVEDARQKAEAALGEAAERENEAKADGESTPPKDAAGAEQPTEAVPDKGAEES